MFPSTAPLLSFCLLAFVTSSVATPHHGGHKGVSCEDPTDDVIHAKLYSAFDLHASFVQFPAFLNVSDTLDTFRIQRPDLVRIRRSDLYDKGDRCSKDKDAAVPNFDPCPLKWVLNVDDQRRPKMLMEAQCKPCPQGCLGTSRAECRPVRYFVKVLRRWSCDERTGLYDYKQVWEPITVGCSCKGPDFRSAASDERTHSDSRN